MPKLTHVTFTRTVAFVADDDASPEEVAQFAVHVANNAPMEDLWVTEDDILSIEQRDISCEEAEEWNYATSGVLSM